MQHAQEVTAFARVFFKFGPRFKAIREISGIIAVIFSATSHTATRITVMALLSWDPHVS